MPRIIQPIPGQVFPSYTTQANSSNTYITPAPLPVVNNSPSSYQQSLSNQLAGQVTTLFQDLFPITQSVDDVAAGLTNFSAFNQTNILNDIYVIKTSILAINQITNQSTSRIPNGFQTGGAGSDPTEIAGLNGNIVLDTVNLIYIDVVNNDYAAAQSDYATLRDQLRPYFNL